MSFHAAGLLPDVVPLMTAFQLAVYLIGQKFVGQVHSKVKHSTERSHALSQLDKLFGILQIADVQR